MTSSFRERDNDLVVVDYGDLLENILRVIRNQNPFKLANAGKQLLIDIDGAAAEVASRQVQNPLGASEQRARTATINFSSEFREKFPAKVREIRDCLRQLLESALGQDSSIEQFVNSLVTDLQIFNKTETRLGFNYNFDKRYQELQKQKLSVDSNNSILKFHKLTITVKNTREFDAQLQESLSTHINRLNVSESEQEELRDLLQGMVADNLSDFHQLKRVLDTETLGKLKKQAKINYLEYLLVNIRSTYTQNGGSDIYLEDIIRRLKLIESYINDVERDDAHYEVNYAGSFVNYKDLFSRSEVWDALPIIPIIVGNLGETTDRTGGDRTFIFGLKLKLGGSVQTSDGKPVFDYNLNLLNPDSQEHQAELTKNSHFGEKVLKIALLYYFVFASRSNPLLPDYHPNSEVEYDPVSRFTARILPTLQGTDEDAKRNIFRAIQEGLEKINVRVKIHRLGELLRKFLDRQPTLPTQTYILNIGVRRGILEQNSSIILAQGTFFKDVLLGSTREALRYISVTDNSDNKTAFCQLPVNITIEDIRYSLTEERQQFSMEYDIKGIKALPVLLVPKADKARIVYKNHFQQNNLVVFPYDIRRLDPNGLNSAQAFIYRFTWVVLAYIILKILLKNTQGNLFIPILRLHLGDTQNPSPSEEFTAALFKVISHLLKEEYLSSCQGFRIQRELSAFQIRNGLSSLYSVLPKKFRFTDAKSIPNLDKVAIIVVSSRESDVARNSKNRLNRLANLMGEVVSCSRLEDGAVQIETLKTFSDNYSVRSLYKNPAILIDTVDNLYKSGFRHFLYIAQAPYSSTLHITQSNEDEGLFFMSPTLIKALKREKDDMKLYPVFFDKYYVRKFQKNLLKSLYIPDTKELTTLVSDINNQVVVFFNLFNGITVGSESERFYNGVISYSTLLNSYQGIIDDEDIYQGLIYDTPLKTDLLQYITLFHFSRYEARQNINLKLDPYKNIIGDDSFGAQSLFNHMTGSAEFNSLAFLTEIKKALI